MSNSRPGQEAAKASRDQPLAWHLALLCFALGIPILILGSLLAWSYVESEGDLIEQGAIRSAHDVMAATDREFAGLIATIKVLGLSRFLQNGEFDNFDAQARNVYRQIGINVIVRDRDGHQVVNTRLPRGAPLPTNVEPESDRAVIATKKPIVSDLFIGAATRRPLFIVNAPVLRDGEVVYFLNLSLEPERLREVIGQSGLPAGWSAAVADRRHMVVAHSTQHETMLNRPLPVPIRISDERRDGVIQVAGPGADGQEDLVAFSRSSLSGWIAVVSVPASEVAAPLRRAQAGIGGVGAAILVLSIGLSLVFSRRIAGPVDSLAIQAARLGHGERALPLTTPLREVNALSRALFAADLERRTAENALRTSEERYRTLSAATSEGVAIHQNWRIIEANDAFRRMFGHGSREQLLGIRALKLISPADRKSVIDHARRGTVEYHESACRRPDGTTFPVEFSCRPIVYQGHSMQVIILRDLTARKNAEVALRASEARLQLAQAAGRIGTWEWDIPSGRAICSESYNQLYGLDLKGSGHQSPEDWLAQVHPDDRERVAKKWTNALDSGQLESEYRIVRTDGSIRWIVDRGTATVDSHGHPTCFIGVNVDITERREAEQRMRELQADLLHASRLSAMGQMAAALAHELNQPLGAAANFLSAARLALKSARPDAPARALARIEKGVEQTVRAGAILGRLRDYIASGETEKRIVSAPQLLEDAVALALVGAKDPSLRVRFDLAPKTPPILADRIQIQQIVFNLVRNAIEATEGRPLREIVVATRVRRDTELEISVSDTGPGLPANPDAVFQPFASTKPKGMGIGLSICRTIAQAHGGRLWAERRADGGAVFRFTLPIEVAEETIHA